MTDAIRGRTRSGEERLRWTSVPRWAVPELPAAASYLACWFGPAAEVPVRTAGFAGRWDGAAEAELRRLLAGCLTGVRIILAGPESVVLRAAALARHFGAASEELVIIATEAAAAAADAEDGGAYVDGTAGRRVFCAGCRRPFDAVAALGGVVTCPGCATALIVDHRFSRPHAAYFGWPAGLDLHR